MDNDQFNDVGILITLANLKRCGMLHKDDRETLVACLSPWGKEQVDEVLSSGATEAAPRDA